MVDILTIYHNFRMTTFYKLSFQHFDGTIININGINLCTRNHTITYFGISKVERIMEDLYLFFYLILILCIINA